MNYAGLAGYGGLLPGSGMSEQAEQGKRTSGSQALPVRSVLISSLNHSICRTLLRSVSFLI
jgi:hypothetical protein